MSRTRNPKKIKITEQLEKKKHRLSKRQKEARARAYYRKTYYARQKGKLTPKQHSASTQKRAKKGTGLQGRAGMYWTEEIDQVIELYNNTENAEQREAIFNEKLKYPFEKLVENVFNTFKFCYIETSPVDAMKEAVAHLVMNIDRFDSSKGKSFSYFSIIAKHYLIALNNGNYKRFNTNTSIHEIADHFKDDTHLPNELTHQDEEREDFQTKEMFRKMIAWFDNNLKRLFPKEKELILAQAVVELLRHVDRLEILNKKYLLLMVREISGCSKTSKITVVVNRMIDYYRKLRIEYTESGDINCQPADRKNVLPLVTEEKEGEQSFAA